MRFVASTGIYSSSNVATGNLENVEIKDVAFTFHVLVLQINWTWFGFFLSDKFYSQVHSLEKRQRFVQNVLCCMLSHIRSFLVCVQYRVSEYCWLSIYGINQLSLPFLSCQTCSLLISLLQQHNNSYYHWEKVSLQATLHVTPVCCSTWWTIWIHPFQIEIHALSQAKLGWTSADQ